MEQLRTTDSSPPERVLRKEDREKLGTQELLAFYKETGDESLKWEIVLRYTDQVKRVASQARGLFNNFAQLDDVIDEGVLVLANAVEKFDASKGIKFETYISKRLRGMMIDLARKQDWVPRQVRQNAVRLNRTTDELTEQLGHVPSSQEMAEHMGINLDEYEEMRAGVSISNLMSFEALLEGYGTDGAVVKEPQPQNTSDGLPEETYLEKELYHVLTKGITSLRENEQLVLSLYYEKELSMKEIAQVMEVSAPRVSQIHSSAIQHLRSFMEEYIKG